MPLIKRKEIIKNLKIKQKNNALKVYLIYLKIY